MAVITYAKNRKVGRGFDLLEPYTCTVPIRPPHDIQTRSGLISLSSEGILKVMKWYWWDGPSKPAIKTKNFMRGSLIHDALYGLLRQRQLPAESRVMADEALREACLEDGMSRLRAWWVYRGVRIGGKGAIRTDICTAP